ncbi:hypothetical protein [Allocoleopsis sp.]
MTQSLLTSAFSARASAESLCVNAQFLVIAFPAQGARQQLSDTYF